jgi:hypothetical protein
MSKEITEMDIEFIRDGLKEVKESINNINVKFDSQGKEISEIKIELASYNAKTHSSPCEFFQEHKKWHDEQAQYKQRFWFEKAGSAIENLVFPLIKSITLFAVLGFIIYCFVLINHNKEVIQSAVPIVKEVFKNK